MDDYKILHGVFITSTDGSKEAAMEIFVLNPILEEKIPNSRVPGAREHKIYLNWALHWFVVHGEGVLNSFI